MTINNEIVNRRKEIIADLKYIISDLQRLLKDACNGERLYSNSFNGSTMNSLPGKIEVLRVLENIVKESESE